VFLPAEIVGPVTAALGELSRLQRYALAIDVVALRPGDVFALRHDLSVRAFRTRHSVPSLGYQFFRRVQKLRADYLDLPGEVIARRRKAGEDLFRVEERLELAYATDTLLGVIDDVPSLLETRVLILECSFLDERKSLADSRAGCHVHLDELLARADDFRNEHLVLMHFSQLYSPADVHRLLRERCPPSLAERLVVFAPRGGSWPG
jgi:ribonuclease Z